MKQSNIIAIMVSSLGISFAATSHATTGPYLYSYAPGAACSLANTSDHHISPYQQRWYGGLVNDNYAGISAIAICPLQPNSPSGASPYPITDISSVQLLGVGNTFQDSHACILCTSYWNCFYGDRSSDGTSYSFGNLGYMSRVAWTASPMTIECNLPSRGIIASYQWWQYRP